MENFPYRDPINMIFGYYKHDDESISTVFESLGLDKSLKKDFSDREGFFRMCDFIVAQKHEIKELKAKFKNQISITENKVLNPIDNQRIEELTSTIKVKDKRIEELESKTPNKEELLLQKDKIIEELTKERDETKKDYEELWDNFQLQFQIKTDLETKIKDLETKTPFKSSSKSKRKPKSTDLKGQQKTLL